MKIKNAFLLSLIFLLLLSGCQKKDEKITADYDRYLFDTSYVHEIDITISDEDWKDLIEDPMAKKKYSVDITIDGETLKDVSFNTKGNSSLAFTAADENSDRYPFRINFGKNVKGQTYHGLDKLSLNNLFEDSTYMKEYVSYELFRKCGVSAPLVSFVLLKINGRIHGLYEAVEDIDSGFLGRNYRSEGVLYKPEGEGIELSLEDVEAIRNGAPVPMGEAHGADFVYIDDQIESYSDIFENAENHCEEEDKLEVIEALKAISENRDLEKYLDTDEIIRYFAVNTFLMNFDSYIGPMLHNYFLYEDKGRISLLPWDYNLSFATMSILVSNDDYKDPTGLINSGIDSPLFLSDEENRPMWAWIIRNDEYLGKYHEAFDVIVDHIESGEFEKENDRIHEMLGSYVKEDPDSPYSFEQYEEGYRALKDFCILRSRSIGKQLDGSLSKRSTDQRKEDQVDASWVDLLKMNAQW